jgi:hypothetical protein
MSEDIRGYDGPADWDLLALRTSHRFPKLPTREELPENEREDYDEMQRLIVQRVILAKSLHPYRHRISGGYFGLGVNPKLALTLNSLSDGLHQGVEGSFTAADHEFIDLVLCFDAGHWGFIANHTPFAVGSGIAVETIEALRDGREDELSDADRQIVAFIRATRDGTITDPMWDAMVERFGTERGVIDFVWFVMLLHVHVRLMQAFDDVQITPEEYKDELNQLRAGTMRLPPIWHEGPEETRPVPAGPYGEKKS